ncbi:Myb_DNA-binding domain-containing protein [Cephalotus follicularis]|uniref:Myb_DNA-binding domain-containing protein n=1 Tax=Cephalotus follicularis TaxID=3775 RepID=A0A1Q3B0S1_CEPFO|nr:Myb_DNA-binding domain-containing protein [Cephalotus follicularis]
MGLVPPELSLDFRPSFVPKTIGDFLIQVSMIGNVSEKASKVNDFVKELEEELKKIDAFKRELPLCMLLLNDAILSLKEGITQCSVSKAKPVLEEFIPLKKDDNSEEKGEDGGIIKKKTEKDSKDKKNWMSSVQLWNNDDDDCHRPSDTNTIILDPKQNFKLENKERKQSGIEDPFQACKDGSGVRAVTPFKAFKGYPSFPMGRREHREEELPVPGLSLLTPGIKMLREDSGSTMGSGMSCSRAVSSSTPNLQSNLGNGAQPPQQQTGRKQRRCWSPELHRRFVNALQQLGGSQGRKENLATPKQIRELMQVDGLTNDEVKSHLQKYRLHSRRLPSAATSSPANQSISGLGSLWMNQDQYGDSSKASSSQSGSPQGPLQLGGNNGGTSTTGGDSIEDDEDAKSEGFSWKSHINKSRKGDV